MKSKREREKIADLIRLRSEAELKTKGIPDFNENRVAALLRRCDALVDSIPNFSHSEILGCTNPIVSPSVWSKLRTGDRDQMRLGRANYFRISEYLQLIDAKESSDRRNEVEAVPGHLYFSLVDHFEMWERTETHLQANLPGIYASYRPSLGADGYVAAGLFFIYKCPKTKTMQAEERVIVRSRVGQIHESPQRVIRFAGPVIRLKQQYIFLMTDSASRMPRFSMFTELISHPIDDEIDVLYKDKTRKVIQLEGNTTGFSGLRRYYTSQYLERIRSWNTILLHSNFKERDEDVQLNARGVQLAEHLLGEKYPEKKAAPIDVSINADIESAIDLICEGFFEQKRDGAGDEDSLTAPKRASEFCFDVHPIEIIPPNARHYLERNGASLNLS